MANMSKEFRETALKLNELIHRFKDTAPQAHALAITAKSSLEDLVEMNTRREIIIDEVLECEDCSRTSDQTNVEAAGCPDAIKQGAGKPATLCDNCFTARDRWSDEA